MDQPSHIFVVGLPRSGTTLLKRVLTLAPEVAISPETHFFGPANVRSFIGRPSMERWSDDGKGKKGFRREIAPIDWTTDRGADELIDLMYSQDSTYLRWLQTHVDPAETKAYLLATERSDRALFDTMMAIYAKDKPIRGEKTPTNLFHVPTLMNWFPHAKIIHIMRDPRAVYVSHKKKWKSEMSASTYHQIRRSDLSLLIYITAAWLEANKLHHLYASQFPQNYYYCKFEDFTRSPKAYLETICGFLGIEFRGSMLFPAEIHNSGLVPQNEEIRGIDTMASDRWREHINPLENLWFTIWARKHL